MLCCLVMKLQSKGKRIDECLGCGWGGGGFMSMLVCVCVCGKASMPNPSTKKAKIWHVVFK